VDDGLAFGLGDRFGVDVAELAFGGAEAGALGDEGDDEGEDAVEVVELFLRFVAGHHQEPAEQGLEEDRDLGGAEQVPEGNRGLLSEPGDTSERSGGEVEPDQTQAHCDVDAEHGLNPPKRVGIPLTDAENHYVASCHKLGV
jgi:hypothetical protein